MAFWSNWFGGGAAEQSKPLKTLEYKGFIIEALPYKDGGMWQLAGLVRKGDDSHRFVRADKFNSAEEAADIAISKGQLIVDQSGDSIFK